MDRMIYLAMSGAKASMQRQESLANNLANSSTVGFRAELQAFQALPTQSLSSGLGTRVYALESSVGYKDDPGPMMTTGRNLDVAMVGNAWLSVQGLDGAEAYTRAGSMHVAADGTLTTSSGLPVLGDGGPIQVPPNAEITVGQDGTVSASVNGRNTQVGRIKLVTPEQALTRSEDGLFRNPDGPLPLNPNARLREGALEGSNVSPVECMVAMIAAARQFETQMKLLQSAEGNEKASSQLLNLS